MNISVSMSISRNAEKALSQSPSADASRPPHIQDFESSPLRFEYDAILEEYRVLWAEIQTRNTDQHQIVNYAIALLAGFLAVSQLFTGSTLASSSPHLLRLVYPLLAMVFSAFAMLFHHHSTMMADIGVYTNTELRPRLERILTATNNHPQIWQWNEWRGRNQFRRFPNNLFEFVLSASGYVITFLPGIAFIILFCVSRDPTEPFATWELVLLILASLNVACAAVTGIYAALRFRRVGSTSTDRN